MIKKTLPLLATCGLAVSGALGVTVPSAYAEFTSTYEVDNNTVESGTVVVQLVTADGGLQTSPIVSLTNAQPSMTTKTYVIQVKNAGTLPETIEVHSTSLVPSTANLNDVLQAVVKSSSGTTLYSGSVSGLSVSLASLAAGDEISLTLELTWPDAPLVDDDPYQDATLSFALTADASQLIA